MSRWREGKPFLSLVSIFIRRRRIKIWEWEIVRTSRGWGETLHCPARADREQTAPSWRCNLFRGHWCCDSRVSALAVCSSSQSVRDASVGPLHFRNNWKGDWEVNFVLCPGDLECALGQTPMCKWQPACLPFPSLSLASSHPHIRSSLQFCLLIFLFHFLPFLFHDLFSWLVVLTNMNSYCILLLETEKDFASSPTYTHKKKLVQVINPCACTAAV